MTLRDWLAEQGMTQAELARRLNLSTVYVWQVVSGAREITPGFRGRFLMTFGPEATASILSHDSPSGHDGVPQ